MKKMTPLGFCLLPEKSRHTGRSVVYPHYMREILSHAGICYETIPFENLLKKISSLRILLTVGETDLSEKLKTALTNFINSGGAWISIGGACGMSDLLGVDVLPPSYQGWSRGVSSIGEGYLRKIDHAHPVLQHVNLPLHFFGGIAVKNTRGKLLADALDVHQRKTPRAALVESRKGKGRCLFIAPDVTGSIVRIQQGLAVTRDGVPAPDGTAPVNEMALKCDDSIVLDWIFDRRGIKGVKGYKAFLDPVADLWREIVLRSIFYLAQKQKSPLPLLWLYPRNKPALAHMSNDTDVNVPERAERLIQVLGKAGVHSTWCVILPGYEKKLARKIRESGHELGMHFDALEDNEISWSEPAFKRQYKGLTRLFRGQKPLSNKNHYTIWKGDTEFYEWCARAGIQLDQSKGPSKTGDVGFLFGTCHPYFPLDPRGSRIDVLELPFLTQDLVITAPCELADYLLESSLKCHGVAHFLFHPHHIMGEEVEKALLETVKKAKDQGMEWWTASEINAWERSRRNVSWKDFSISPKGFKVSLKTECALKDATILWLAPDSSGLKINGETAKSELVKRWGFPFFAMTSNLPKSGSNILECIL
ncbi:hypothetical protein JW926_06145 [Candidatus Sumerlaeota bacterium]|nr:hypothetical protein [Candidatus Sumerlaeota bacterium]